MWLGYEKVVVVYLDIYLVEEHSVTLMIAMFLTHLYVYVFDLILFIYV